MTDIELEEYFNRIGLLPSGRRLVEKARVNAPVRAVQSRIGNVITEFQSAKMNRTIATESRTVEYPAVVQHEHDKSVLEYYAQPVSLDITVTDSNGRRTSRHLYTPDFLLLRDDRVIIEEWRPESTMIKKASKHPGRFERDEHGWRFPAVELQLHAMGIEYRLRTDDEHPQLFVENLTFLADFYSPDADPLDEATMQAIKSCFETEACLSLADLIALGQGPQSSDGQS